MRHFRGLEVQPVSHITQFPATYIDRAVVRVHKNLLGQVVYTVEGSHMGSDVWVPLCRGTVDFEAAWAIKCEFDRKIDAARAEDRARYQDAMVRFHGADPTDGAIDGETEG